MLLLFLFKKITTKNYYTIHQRSNEKNKSVRGYIQRLVVTRDQCAEEGTGHEAVDEEAEM